MRDTDSYVYMHASAWHCGGYKELLGGDLVSGSNYSGFCCI